MDDHKDKTDNDTDAETVEEKTPTNPQTMINGDNAPDNTDNADYIPVVLRSIDGSITNKIQQFLWLRNVKMKH